MISPRFAKALCILPALLTAGSAAAARPDTRTMSCAKAVATVRSHGAIVLTTGQHTFDRYVANSAYCLWPDVAVREYVRTADGRCPLYACRESPFEFYPFGF